MVTLIYKEFKSERADALSLMVEPALIGPTQLLSFVLLFTSDHFRYLQYSLFQ